MFQKVQSRCLRRYLANRKWHKGQMQMRDSWAGMVQSEYGRVGRLGMNRGSRIGMPAKNARMP